VAEVTTPENSPEAATPDGKRNLVKTLVGVFFMYGSRGLGLLLTLALIARLGIADYGLYVLGLALATMLSAPLDNPWSVRAIRESDEEFAAERVSRFLMGAVFIVAGAALTSVSYFVWFGLAVAGGEIVFNSLKSRSARDGHPDVVWRLDAIRQTSSVVLTCAYLFGMSDPTLQVASLLYCAPYLVILVLAANAVRGHRPAMPGPVRQMAILIGEMGGTVAYLQADVLLLGWLTNSTVVGYYNIPLMLTSALAAVGQSYAMTFHEPLRKSGGDLATGPKLRNTLLISGIVGALVLITGVVMLMTPVPAQMAQAMVIMAGWAVLRTIICIFQVVLYAQRRDAIRFGTTIALIPVKFAILAVLVKLGLGAVGAAIATTATDALLLIVFAGALYWKPLSKPTPKPVAPE
jgi:O-antigen/teichoic acid export membrane protein